MHTRNLLGKLTQLRRARPALWGRFVGGWIRRQHTGFVPCAVPGGRQLLQVPLRDFYESYDYFCEHAEGCGELDFFLARMRSGDVFYDIGAFRAAYAACAQTRFSDAIRVHLFEPVPRNVAVIREIVLLNGFTGFTINPLAVGDDNCLSGSVSETNSMLSPGIATGENLIPAITLDDYIGQGAPPPTIIKIDVEGFELQVLRGARGCLERHRPRLWLEIHPDLLATQDRCPDDAFNFLTELGYAISCYSDYHSPSANISYHIWCV